MGRTLLVDLRENVPDDTHHPGFHPAIVHVSAERSRLFFRIRVTVLSAILAGVAAWGWRDRVSRRERNAWEHTLHVAIVLLRVAPTPDSAFASLRARGPALEDRLQAEARRYRPGIPRPFLFAFFGPIDETALPPVPKSDGVVDLAEQSWRSWRYYGEADARAGVDAGAFDTRLYVVVRASSVEGRTLAEGRSEEGGRTGSVEMELSDTDSADFALLAVAHELFHTLGAEDKYDERGKTRIPLGLAEPELTPQFPQRFAEIMARNRPVAPDRERPPDSLDEMAVGPVTAREIGWAR